MKPKEQAESEWSFEERWQLLQERPQLAYALWRVEVNGQQAMTPPSDSEDGDLT